MINRLIDDMDKALDTEAYMAALAIALILPDMCAKAEYPDIKFNKERYVKWLDEYLCQYNKNDKGEDFNSPYLSGEIIYQLRCMFLHSGIPNIDKDKIEEEINKLNKFSIIIEKKKEFDLYCDYSETTNNNNNNIKEKKYSLNVRKFCKDLELVVKTYYHDNKTKFDFSNFCIIDMDEEIDKLRNFKL